MEVHMVAKSNGTKTLLCLSQEIHRYILTIEVLQMEKYGPFVNVVAIASALVATFSMLLLRMLGSIKQWTWLTSGSPQFLVKAGPRILAVVLMGVTYVTINKANYMLFVIAAVLIGVFGFLAVGRFDHLQKLYIVQIPLVGPNGKQLVHKNKPRFENVVIGPEAKMRPEAKTALEKARKKHGGLSLTQFMAGYGANKLNDPGALWDRDILAGVSNKLSTTLMYIILSAVMAVFLAAFVIDVVS
jgi:hypothetical protein